MKRLAVSALLFLLAGTILCNAARKPNFILIDTDDQGYNDLGCYGSVLGIETPHIDRLATEGMKLNAFYNASSVCTASRASILTGCSHKRIKTNFFSAKAKQGMHPDEVTIADHLKANGYATACIGKWHLGHLKPFLPLAQGFDYYYGIPFSNDMNPGDGVPLMKGNEIIEQPVEQKTLTRRYTDEALKFIKECAGKPFFVYLAHAMPHVPLFYPDDFESDAPTQYGRTVEHLDAETGRLMEYIRGDKKLATNTFVIFTSDNGPWLSKGKEHSGRPDPCRGGKFTTWDGGSRVPCIMWAPGKIGEGAVTDEIVSSMDIFPTLASLAQAELGPADTRGPIDGLDISGFLLGRSKASPRKEIMFYTNQGHLQGFRQGDFKIRIAGGPQLYEITKDPGEADNLYKKGDPYVAR